MFTCNYHTHTKRCGHAVGEDEEYVLESLGRGFKILGFSDHAMLPDFKEPQVRGDYELFDDYVDSITELKKRYEGRIKIYLGIEAEAFPDYFPFFKELLSNKVIDYMILGNHCAIDSKKRVIARFSKITNASQLYLYKDLAIQALSTGMYSIFAHPDYFLSSIDQFDSDCKKVSREIVECAVAYDIPLEINLGGIRNGRKWMDKEKNWIYPREEFFKIVSKYQAKCIFGLDAHSPKHIADKSSYFEAADFAKKLDLLVIDRLEQLK